MSMKSFLIPIAIGLILIALLLIRIVGIGENDANSNALQNQNKKKSGKHVNSSESTRGLSEQGKIRIKTDLDKIAAVDTKTEHKFKTFYDTGGFD